MKFNDYYNLIQECKRRQKVLDRLRKRGIDSMEDYVIQFDRLLKLENYIKKRACRELD